MRNIALKLMYNGTAYHGWQVQKNAVTVCETLQKALEKITGAPVHLTGCGRTDAGVHAERYIANFRTESRIPLERLPFAINTHTPEDIAVSEALEVADDVLRVCGCDLKAISYFASYLPLIEDRKFKPEQHIRVLSNTRPYQGGMEYENSFGGVKYRLPYLPIVEEQAATLKLLEPLSGKEAKSYEPVIAAIAVEVFGDGK